jgi:hypothetical protein
MQIPRHDVKSVQRNQGGRSNEDGGGTDGGQSLDRLKTGCVVDCEKALVFKRGCHFVE